MEKPASPLDWKAPNFLKKAEALLLPGEFFRLFQVLATRSKVQRSPIFTQPSESEKWKSTRCLSLYLLFY